MKKIVSLFSCILLILTFCAACGATTAADTTAVADTTTTVNTTEAISTTVAETTAATTEAVDRPVVYVKDGGTGDGSSATEALSTLESAYAALDLSKHCIVVICGPFTQQSAFAYGNEYSGSVTITSVYGGTDYRASGAKYQFNASNFACYGDTRFENLNFVSTAGGMVLVGQYNPVTIGEGVTMTGDKLTGGSMAKSFTIVGGYDKNIGTPKTENTGDIHITVLSGSKYYIF